MHNKLKPKEAELPPNVTYMAGEEVPDKWNCYPWDAAAYGRDIYAHEALAAQWYNSHTCAHTAYAAFCSPHCTCFSTRSTETSATACPERVQRWREGECRAWVATGETGQGRGRGDSTASSDRSAGGRGH